MAIASHSMFAHYKKRIQAFPSPPPAVDVLSEEFLLERDLDNKLEIYYAPFEYINEHARILIAGITPGLRQMLVAYRTVHALKNENMEDEKILHEVRKQASYEGPMRRNLIAMLDGLGLAGHLGLESSVELFGAANNLVQTASVLPYPVFFDGKNYSGSRPPILKPDLLKHYSEGFFAKEMAVLKSPLIIPLGANAASVIESLGRKGLIDTGHILYGLPHPSGANGHRHRHYAENRERMQQQIARFFR